MQSRCDGGIASGHSDGRQADVERAQEGVAHHGEEEAVTTPGTPPQGGGRIFPGGQTADPAAKTAASPTRSFARFSALDGLEWNSGIVARLLNVQGGAGPMWRMPRRE
jgi:hypothetical protein